MAKKGVISKEKVKVSRRNMVPPVNVTRLMDKHLGVGGTRAAAALGVSTTLLYKAKKDNAVNKVVEIAAAGALESLGKSFQPQQVESARAQHMPTPRGGEVMFMVTLPADKADMFHRMVSAMGGVAMSA